MTGQPQVDALRDALRAIGVEAEVSAHEGVALVRVADTAALADPARRHAVVALAREHGFVSAAIEVG